MLMVNSEPKIVVKRKTLASIQYLVEIRTAHVETGCVPELTKVVGLT
jgi:hypothetical protein